MKRIKKSLIHKDCGGDICFLPLQLKDNNHKNKSYLYECSICGLHNIPVTHDFVDYLTDEEWDAKYKGAPYHVNCGGFIRLDMSIAYLTEPVAYHAECSVCNISVMPDCMIDKSIEYLTKKEWQQKYGDKK